MLPPPRETYRARARQWGRTAWAMALLMGSLPVAGRLVLGVWTFNAATAVAFLCLMAGAYFHIVARRSRPALPDEADLLSQSLQLASEGRAEEAISLLTETIRLSPKLWQARQYRGEIYLSRQDPAAALSDFDEAIRLAPAEPHLYMLRGYAHALLGNEVNSRRDYDTAAGLVNS